jgi:hypothetical protein
MSETTTPSWMSQWLSAYPYIANKSTGIKLGDYEDAKRKFGKAWLGANPYTGTAAPNYSQADREIMGYNTPELNNAQWSNEAWANKGNDEFFKQLTPEQRQEYSTQKDAAYKKNQHLAQMAFLAAAGAMAAPGVMGALGGTSGGAGAGAGATGIGADTFGSGFGLDMFGGGFGATLPPELGNLPAGMFGSGLGEIGGIGAGLGGLGSLSGLSGLSGLDNLVGGAKDLVGGAKDLVSGGNSNTGGGLDWGKILGGTNLGLAGLAAIQGLRNKNSLPSVPDFLKLAEQQNASQNINQVNAQGDTLNWTKNPNGQWTQATKFSAPNQQRFDQQAQMAAALRKQIMDQQSNPSAPPPIAPIDLKQWSY